MAGPGAAGFIKTSFIFSCVRAAYGSNISLQYHGLFLKLYTEFLLHGIFDFLRKLSYLRSGRFTVVLYVIRMLFARHRVAHARAFHTDLFDEPSGGHAAFTRLHSFLFFKHFPHFFRRYGIHEKGTGGAHVLDVPPLTLTDRLFDELLAHRSVRSFQLHPHESDDPLGMVFEETVPVRESACVVVEFANVT